MPPNILLIMSDQHRADALGIAGHPVLQTPNLDRLAREGVRFDRAYCQGPLCMPARASFLTERYVRDHGVDNNAKAASPDYPTFVRELQRAGYHTACIGKMHLYTKNESSEHPERVEPERLHALGFTEAIEGADQTATPYLFSEYTDFLEERGHFKTYRDWVDLRLPGGCNAYIDGRHIPRTIPMWQAESVPLPADEYPDAWVGARTRRWLAEREGSQPWFLQVGFPGPHSPWDAPKEYVDRYRDAVISGEMSPPPPSAGSGPLDAHMRRLLTRFNSAALTPEIIREVRRFYYANITLIDEQIGLLLAALEEQGTLADTWVIYTTDHGEMMGDHHLLAKMVMYEPSVRVPLIIRPPQAVAGTVVDGLVEHVDLAATIRAIAGAGEIPECEGRSLLGHIEARGAVADSAFRTPQSAFVREVAFSQTLGFAMAVTRRYKLVVHEQSRQPVQLFDLEADPAENRNLVAEPEHTAVREDLMRRVMLPFLEREPLPA